MIKKVGDEDETPPPPAENESESEGTSGGTESEDESQSGESDGDGASEQSPFGNYAGGGASGNDSSQGASEKENGRIPLEQTDRCSNPLDGSVERNEDYEHLKNEKAASDIERILDKMAERAACAELENERLTELNEAAQSISYGDIHSGVQIRVNRIASVDETLVEQYDEISAPLLTISRQLQKSIVRHLKDSRRGGKQTGLLMGRRLDSHALHRTDGKVFCKNNLPNEIPELAVGLLLDESGSMWSRDRCTYVRAAAIACVSTSSKGFVYYFGVTAHFRLSSRGRPFRPGRTLRRCTWPDPRTGMNSSPETPCSSPWPRCRKRLGKCSR